MTSQTKKFIELTDMLSLRFECKHCNSELLISSLRDLELGTLNNCPVCGRPWASINGSTCEPTIAEFLTALNKLRVTVGRHENVFPAGFNLTIEIKDDKPTPILESA